MDHDPYLSAEPAPPLKMPDATQTLLVVGEATVEIRAPAGENNFTVPGRRLSCIWDANT